MNVVDCEVGFFCAELKKNDEVAIYIDGACSGNPGPGGWGVVLLSCGKKLSLSGFEKETTNNRMELMAAIEAIKFVKNVKRPIKCSIYTDSSYVKNGITTWIKTWKANNWKSSSGKFVKNQDLWCQLSLVCDALDIEWFWIKGHSDNVYNEAADLLARNAIVSSYMLL